MACVALLGLSSATNARAEESHPALHWFRAENAAECVDPRTLSELVETYTGPVLVAPASADTSIEATIERESPEAFRLRVNVTVTRGRPAGQRVLSLPAADCRKLDGAIAFVIASTLDPDLGSGALPAELSWLHSETPAAEQLREELAAAPAGPPRASTPPRPAASVAAATEEPRASVAEDTPAERSLPGPWELGLAFVTGRGRVPAAAVGGLISVAHGFGSAFALTLHLRASAAAGGFDVEAGRSIGVETYDGALLACGRAGNVQAFRFQGCLGPGVGFFSAHGRGFDRAHTVFQPLYGAQLEIEASFAIADRLALTAAGLLDLGFRRPVVNYEILQEWHQAFRSEVYSLQAAIGLTRSF
jgi:hypothetical protein